MNEDYITRREHEEFTERIKAEHKRLEDEDSRQNHRLDTLESSVERISALTSNVERLAVNMENMLKELSAQGKRLETLEKRDGESWRNLKGYLLTGGLGLLLGLAPTFLKFLFFQ